MVLSLIIAVCNICFTILGQGNVQAKQVADAMLDAVIDVLSQNSSTTLKTIRIIIFQPPMLKDFFNSMEQREATHPKAKSLLGSLASKIKGKCCEENYLYIHISQLFQTLQSNLDLI